MSIERSRLPVSPHLDEEPVVDSIYVTRTLRLDKRRSISKLLNEISESSTIDFDFGLRKLRSEVQRQREFKIKVSVKQISEPSIGGTRESADYTDRIRLRIETARVTYGDIETVVQEVLEACNQLEQEMTPVWDERGTYSLTVVLQDQVVAGREISQTASGLFIEIFGENIRVRNVKQNNLDEALEILTQL